MTDILEVTDYQPARPPDGLTAARWKEKLKELYPEPAEGTCREVPPELQAQLALAQEASAFWKTQVETIKARIRSEMGGVETATIDGVPFMVRKLVPYTGHYIPAGFRDMLAPPPKEED